MGFITSPLEFTHSERQTQSRARPNEDSEDRCQTEPNIEIAEPGQLEASRVVLNQATAEEASNCQNGAAVAAGVS